MGRDGRSPKADPREQAREELQQWRSYWLHGDTCDTWWARRVDGRGLDCSFFPFLGFLCSANFWMSAVVDKAAIGCPTEFDIRFQDILPGHQKPGIIIHHRSRRTNVGRPCFTRVFLHRYFLLQAHQLRGQSTRRAPQS